MKLHFSNHPLVGFQLNAHSIRKFLVSFHYISREAIKSISQTAFIGPMESLELCLNYSGESNIEFYNKNYRK